MKILILHGLGDPAETRRTTLNHAFFLPKYAPEHAYTLHRYDGRTKPDFSSDAFDLIILETTFLCNRWLRPRSLFHQLLEDYDFVRRSNAVKIAFPQDEYDHSALLDNWLADWNVDVIYSSCFRDRALFYRRSAQNAEIMEGFTGYVDEVDLSMGRRYARPYAERDIDVGYRARNVSAYVGRLGRLKSVIGAKVADHPAFRRLRLDVSTRPEDTIVGRNWLAFIGNCRFTLGTDSGSSLLDPRGEIKDRIVEFTAREPTASFEAIEAACFPGLDGRYEMTALSPRLFETVIAGSCPVLVEGRYGGILQPNVHYIAIKLDFSNLDEVAQRCFDVQAATAIIQRCQHELLDQERFRYRTLARAVIATAEVRRRSKARPTETSAAADVEERARQAPTVLGSLVDCEMRVFEQVGDQYARSELGNYRELSDLYRKEIVRLGSAMEQMKSERQAELDVIAGRSGAVSQLESLRTLTGLGVPRLTMKLICAAVFASARAIISSILKTGL